MRNEHRPQTVNERVVVGQWEGDTIIRKNYKGAIVPLVKRNSGLGLAAKAACRRAHGVAAAVIILLRPFREQVHTVTFDNGLEFAQHEVIATELGGKIYFADPYSSWQRGSNETLDGLLRQLHPK